ncbi:FMRFamide receptor-like [Babylonia areolata]|uniref:FMRFamide receptor-like n=1 Tax=Babylonia areolata TaxID=304850 RepID=UPI003FD1F146
MSGLMDTPSDPSSHILVIKTPVGSEFNVTYHSSPANDSPALSPDGSSSNASGGGGGGNEGMTAEEMEMVLLTRFVMYGVLGNLLVVLGLLGNTLSIVVLCNRRMRSSTSFYLTSLAVYDNFILLSMLLFFNLPALGSRLPAISGWYARYIVIMPMWYPLSLAAQMGSIYTCVAFTVERFIAVCRPLHAANTCTKSRAKRTILLIFLWSVLYNIPRYFHYEAGRHWNNSTQAHEMRVTETDFAKNDVFRHVYIIYFQLIFMFLLPFLVISVLNAALLKAINRSRQQRQQMSTSATREHNLTVMLVAVIVVFLVCQFPTIVDNILVAIVREEKHGKVLQYQLLYTVCTFLVTINSSLNFVLYCLFGKKFRMVLCHVLGLAPAAHKDCQYRSTTYQSRTNGIHLTQYHTDDVEVSMV